MNRRERCVSSDLFNEVDDQFAPAYALRSPELSVEAIYAAPFYKARSESPKNGMEKSYGEILRLLADTGAESDGSGYP